MRKISVDKGKRLLIIILDDYTTNSLNTTPMVNHRVKYFIISVLWHILGIRGSINFMQLGRFSPYYEQTHRIQFEQEFDFFAFNKHLIQEIVSKDCIIND